MINFQAFRGTVTMVSEFMIGGNDEGEGCYTMISVADDTGGSVNFVVSPTTYFVDQEMVSTGDRVTGYYDGNAIIPLIYPPQHQALVFVKESPYHNVKVDFFNSELVSRDGQLKLNLSPYTQALSRNGQAFTRPIANRNLIVIYGPTTRSIPAQTTPYKIIVWC